MNKVEIVRQFVGGISVTDLAQFHLCRRDTIEAVLRDAVRGLSHRLSELSRERTEQIEEIVTAAENM